MEKTCSRGHVYEGPGPCPVCWPGRHRRRIAAAAKGPQEVEAYIAAAPAEAQARLRAVRAAILRAAPEASERISYRMPAYACHGRLAWFAAMKGYIGLYLRPPIVAEHAEALARYKTTKSAIHLPLAEPLPVALIEQLVTAALAKNRARA